MRGVAGVDLTEDLARELGAAAARGRRAGLQGRARPRHARVGPGARGGAGRGHRRRRRRGAHGRGHPDAGRGDPGRAARAPTLGCVISASHNPYDDNGIKFLGGDGRKLPDARRGRHRGGDGLGLRAGRRPGRAGRGRRRALRGLAGRDVYGDGVRGDRRVVVRLRERRGCGRRTARSPRSVHLDAAFIGAEPDGRNINADVGSTHLDALAAAVRGRRRRRAGSRSTATPTAAWRSTPAAGPSTATRSSPRSRSTASRHDGCRATGSSSRR